MRFHVIKAVTKINRTPITEEILLKHWAPGKEERGPSHQAAGHQGLQRPKAFWPLQVSLFTAHRRSQTGGTQAVWGSYDDLSNKHSCYSLFVKGVNLLNVNIQNAHISLF